VVVVVVVGVVSVVSPPGMAVIGIPTYGCGNCTAAFHNR